ncbi:hypothetical protein K9O30_06265 [Clostridium bowmanii]|uniref:hypothetical protein n=1 Tax=Clostridium bowmanii TaxID=132925 RepID=UPI001C0BD81A|nr:hypothetical protein [Clostridium bowmanii]MBU3188764.1 hypothetical protein [Clostridium bowmanii]MCA1073349.1 hypothetical protein [Clostridium bowmanii]
MEIRNTTNIQQLLSEIETISILIKDIKTIIDISEKTITYTIETDRHRDEVRNYFIELFQLLDRINCAIRDENDELLQNYNESLRQTISEYN